MRQHPDPPVFPVTGKYRRFLPIDERVVDDLDAFMRNNKEYGRLKAILEAICNSEKACHPKLSKMVGPALWELGDFGQAGLLKGQGRLYLYRAPLDGFDTFLICAFRRKKKQRVEKGIEQQVTSAALAFMDRRRTRR